MNNKIADLQIRAKNFLCGHYLKVNGKDIYLKEIEVYYYKQGE